VTCWQVFEACLARLASQSEPRLGGALELELLQHGGRASFRDSAVRAPRLGPRLRALEHARQARQNVVLLYGEDDVVARIDVLPRLLYQAHQKGYLEAECRRSGLLKTYRLDRVRGVAGASFER
jgi:hypothetical protein